MNIKKALVVDDSKVACLALRKLLMERGIEVDWVGSGEDCLQYLDRKNPDIIFMDIMMPGMDGFETSQSITTRNRPGAVPIIMCSANPTGQDRSDARNNGAIGFLPKPYTIEQLDRLLRRIGQTPTVAEPAVLPSPEIPTFVLAGVPITHDEHIVEGVASTAAEEVAQDILQEQVQNLTGEITVQPAQNVAEGSGQQAVDGALNVAHEAIKQAAIEIASSLQMNRDELLKEIESQVSRQIQATLARAVDTTEFKQQIMQMVRPGIQSVIETIARDIAERSIQQAVTDLPAQRPTTSHVTLALVLAVIAVLASTVAILGSILKLF